MYGYSLKTQPAFIIAEASLAEHSWIRCFIASKKKMHILTCLPIYLESSLLQNITIRFYISITPLSFYPFESMDLWPSFTVCLAGTGSVFTQYFFPAQILNSLSPCTFHAYFSYYSTQISLLLVYFSIPEKL